MNLNEQLLQKLINDPGLLRTLEKLAAQAPKEKKLKVLKERGNPAYTNEVTCRCKLCGTSATKYLMMQYDPEEKLYRTGYHGLDNKWPELPVFQLHQRSSSCAACPGVLLGLAKEDLIQKLIFISNK